MLNGFHRGAHPRSLDEVAMAALAAGLDADDTLVDIELVDIEVDEVEELDVTARFARDSAPYERIEVTTIANLVTTKPFQTVEAVNIAPAELPEWRGTSWKWVAYSGAAWALALGVWWLGHLRA